MVTVRPPRTHEGTPAIILKIRPFIFALGLLFLSQPSLALLRVKIDSRSANGACLPVQNISNPQEFLKETKVSFQMADEKPVPLPVVEALAQVISTIDSIGNHRFEQHHGAVFVFGYKDSFSFHTSDANKIFINPGEENRQNLRDKRYGGILNRGVLTHELAHYISLRDHFQLQQRYQKQVQPPCLITDYAQKLTPLGDKNLRAEEFAEVFAAFITNPSLLADQGGGCPAARTFMMKLFSESKIHSNSCEERKTSL